MPQNPPCSNQGHQRCSEHGRCLACDGCDPCETEAQRSSEIGRQVRELPGLIGEAGHVVGKIQAAFGRLTGDLYDIELAEGAAGADALRKLRDIQDQLRDVRRIADARWTLEREYEIAFAAADPDVPEFDDDVVVAFTRDQVNEWAGRRLTDEELARITEALPLSSLPVAVYALVATLGPDVPQGGQDQGIPVGEPFPLRPGYVTGECGHAVAGSEWRAGFRRCEHCPASVPDEPDEPDESETPDFDPGPEIDDQGGMSEVLPSHLDEREG